MESVDVLIVGGGPVGLTLASLLGDLGVQTLLVERRPSTSTHPRAFGIHPRTMEVWRRLGAADAVRRLAVPATETAGIGWMTTLTGDERGRLMFPAPPPVDVSPEAGCFCPQLRYEEVLRHAANLRGPAVSVRFGWEATDLADPANPTVTLVEGSDGRTEAVAPRFVVAADGLASPLRHGLGETEAAVAPFGHSVNVYFRADLRAHRDARPFALTWTVDPGAEGTFAIAGADASEWTFNFAGEADADYSPADLVATIRRAVGDPSLDVEILDVLRWDYDAAVTDHWRQGNVFFCGDSAHRFPPHGGFGMNSGVQDAENLAWKLAAVLRWGAPEQLLDTYEVERKPVAEYNIERALANTEALASARWDPAHAQQSVESQVEHFFTLGQQMGAVYRSTAVIDDGVPIPQSTVTAYAETGAPGARAPHVSLRRADGTKLSTLDLCRGAFAALIGRTHPRTEDAAGNESVDAPIVWATIGPGGCYREVERSFAEVYGVGPNGGVLVRPDGYVAARFQNLPADPGPTIRGAVRALLSGQ